VPQVVNQDLLCEGLGCKWLGFVTHRGLCHEVRQRRSNLYLDLGGRDLKTLTKGACVDECRGAQVPGSPLDFKVGPNRSMGRTYGRILDFSSCGRTENRYAMLFQWVSRVDFRCVLHHFSSLTCLNGSWAKIWSGSDPKPKVKSIF
jgi:hypothetical protein